MSKLTDKAIKAFRPKDKPYRELDDNGLYLTVSPTGGKGFIFRYRDFSGKDQTFTIGKYPAVSLAEARNKRNELLAMLASGIDPRQQKAEEKAQQVY